MHELSHSWYDADKEQELELTVIVNADGEVQCIDDVALWGLEDKHRVSLKAILSLDLLKSSGILDTMIAQVDWKKKLEEYLNGK
jgi:hypothetical protein